MSFRTLLIPYVAKPVFVHERTNAAVIMKSLQPRYYSMCFPIRHGALFYPVMTFKIRMLRLAP